MRRLLALVLFLCSFAVAAQTDERRVRTVQTDEVAEQAESSEERTEPAEHPDEHMVLARQLVALGKDSADDAQSATGCEAASEAIGADLPAAYRARPGDFRGISPQSAYWPEVRRAWHAYHGGSCDDSPAAILARSFAESMSTAELRDVVAFQDSPSGRAFVAAAVRARADLEKELAARAARDPEEAAKTFEQAMRELQARYERAPK
ncbi:MAG: DUF2059 domain-containing protein [Pseudomonadota bacterium]